MENRIVRIDLIAVSVGNHAAEFYGSILVECGFRISICACGILAGCVRIFSPTDSAAGIHGQLPLVCQLACGRINGELRRTTLVNSRVNGLTGNHGRSVLCRDEQSCDFGISKCVVAVYHLAAISCRIIGHCGGLHRKFRRTLIKACPFCIFTVRLLKGKFPEISQSFTLRFNGKVRRAFFNNGSIRRLLCDFGRCYEVKKGVVRKSGRSTVGNLAAESDFTAVVLRRLTPICV